VSGEQRVGGIRQPAQAVGSLGDQVDLGVAADLADGRLPVWVGVEVGDPGVAEGLQLIDSELRAFEFCDEGQAKERLRPYVWRRASAALEALGTGRARYLQDGYA
jgi:hypothetical protein